MADKMLVESDPHETRIAVLEEDRLTEIFLERRQHRGVVGNVYKGRVTRVLPGMQAAFVDLGLDRDAFLYVADVAPAVPPEIETELASTEDLLDDTASSGPSIDTLLRPGQEQVRLGGSPDTKDRLVDGDETTAGGVVDGQPRRRRGHGSSADVQLCTIVSVPAAPGSRRRLIRNCWPSPAGA